MIRVISGFLFIHLFHFGIGQEGSSPVKKPDSDKIAILKKIQFEKNTRYFNLSDSEFLLIDEILQRCLDEYNRGRDSSANDFIKVDRYRRQYIPFIKDGQKYVWANFFCASIEDHKNWKKKPVLVFDGGACYFRITINLSKSRFFNFYVNGLG